MGVGLSSIPIVLILLADTLVWVHNLGIKTVLLVVGDSGSGKLFKYYYNLGFRCLDEIQTQRGSIKDECIVTMKTNDYNDFLSGDSPMERIHRNKTHCFSMKANVIDILKNIKL